MALKATAFLIHQDELHYTDSLEYPVSTLIESIWKTLPQFARAITRNRIFYDRSLEPICQGMIKVAAKRSSLLTHVEFQALINSEMKTKTLVRHFKQDSFYDCPIKKPIAFNDIEHAMNFALELAEVSNSSVGAILLDENYNLISWGWNEHFKNRVLHAEIMVVKNFIKQFQNSIPQKFTLITTLQPCAMCAGYLHAHSESFCSLKIVYLNEDLGPFAQNSILISGTDLYKKSNLSSVPSISRLIKKPQ